MLEDSYQRYIATGDFVVVDRFALMPLLEGLIFPFARLVRRANCPYVWEMYVALGDRDLAELLDMFEMSVSPRVRLVTYGIEANGCDPGEAVIGFLVHTVFPG